MEKTINIDLGGTLFQIDEEAYRILREYLQSITLKFKNVPGGNETINDIESRIAEIFQSQKFTAGVINKENVEAMISIIGKPEDFDQDGNGEPVHGYTSYQRRKMYRNPDDKIIGGICGGIGTYLNTDPVWFRILFILFALTFGIGFLVYLALWIALPSAATESQKKEMYGSSYNLAISGGKEKKPYTATTDVGNAFNEVFRAIGKVLFVIVRIILINYRYCTCTGGIYGSHFICNGLYFQISGSILYRCCWYEHKLSA
jgi:phage shock protein PspC (stress-responsive transcriptional regulator)